MNIRKATADDAPLLLGMLREYASELPDFMPAMDGETALSEIMENIAMTAIAFRGDEPAGFITLMRSPVWWSRQEVLSDRAIFVRKDHRASTIGRELISIAKRSAKKAGLPLVLTVSSGVAVDRKDRLYQRLGGIPLGGSYLFKGA